MISTTLWAKLHYLALGGVCNYWDREIILTTLWASSITEDLGVYVITGTVTTSTTLWAKVYYWETWRV